MACQNGRFSNCPRQIPEVETPGQCGRRWKTTGGGQYSSMSPPGRFPPRGAPPHTPGSASPTCASWYLPVDSTPSMESIRNVASRTSCVIASTSHPLNRLLLSSLAGLASPVGPLVGPPAEPGEEVPVAVDREQPLEDVVVALSLASTSIDLALYRLADTDLVVGWAHRTLRLYVDVPIPCAGRELGAKPSVDAVRKCGQSHGPHAIRGAAVTRFREGGQTWDDISEMVASEPETQKRKYDYADFKERADSGENFAGQPLE